MQVHHMLVIYLYNPYISNLVLVIPWVVHHMLVIYLYKLSTSYTMGCAPYASYLSI